jgi:chitinase
LLLAGSAFAAMAATKTSTAPEPSHPLLVGYFPQWGLYAEQPYTVKSMVQTGAAAMLDQLNYAQGFVTGGRCSIADPHADLDYTFSPEASLNGSADSPSMALRGNFHQLVELKRRYPHLKILISLEGRESDFAADAQPENRSAFVASCVDLFLKGNFAAQANAPGLFDGIDLDWEYPRGADAANYLQLLGEFRRQMDALRPGLRLSIALGASPAMYGDADIPALGGLVDLAGVMTYDYNGPWSSTTGFLAPLYSPSADQGSVEKSVIAWKQAGMPAAKLLIGLPFYAYGWRSVPGANHGLGQSGSPIRGDHSYRFIENLIDLHPGDLPAAPALSLGSPSVASGEPPAAQMAANEATLPYRDPVSQAPWLFDGSSFWTYEDPVSIRTKAAFAQSQQVAGFMIWELSDDTASATLLNAAHNALVQPDAPDPPIAESRTRLTPTP